MVERDDTDFKLGDIVETIKGAKFWGEIIAFDNDGKSAGCTVLAVAPGFEGTKHVYPLKQLARRSAVPAVAAEVVVVFWQWRQFHSGKWHDWNPCWSATSHADNSDYWRDLAARMPNEVQVRALVPASAISERERKLREALQNIARQPLSTEPSGDADDEELDFTGGYDLCIERARAALSEAP